MNITNNIKTAFIDYFVNDKKHKHLKSSSLIPENDNSVLFTNSGMMQFKEIFLGNKISIEKKIITIQRCLRVGGKHNDLDIVGYSDYHHTFFEMLGVFSFGDYFKEKAIYYILEFLTKILNLSKDKMFITVLKNDYVSKNIWLSLGINKTRIIEKTEIDNFWTMGNEGPCGPCSEIFYCISNHIDLKNSIEICNLVFIQFNMINKKLYNLHQNYVDIGLGLERLSSIIHDVTSTYKIDIFKVLIRKIGTLFNIKNLDDPSLRVLSDHIRAVVFLILDGVKPGKDGKEYVLRKIIRRSILHGFKINIAKTTFFYKIVDVLIKSHYPKNILLLEKQSLIEKILIQEEENFKKNLYRGIKLFNSYVKFELKTTVIPGSIVFKLYDTYGFPLEITQSLAKDLNLSINKIEFNNCMNKQISMSKTKNIREDVSNFIGYDLLECNTIIINLYKSDVKKNYLNIDYLNEKGIIILKDTPFFAESGGQKSDIGFIKNNNNAIFEVLDVKKINDVFLHFGKVIQGIFKKNDLVQASVSKKYRMCLSMNHTATHLLYAALRKVYGLSIEQKGSVISSKKLRFDFANPHPLSKIELDKIEYIINNIIRKNLDIKIIKSSIKNLKNIQNSLYFNKINKNDNTKIVRILKIGSFSTEACCGTHVSKTSQIGFFKIISENSISSGIRRIIAYTGDIALEYCQNLEKNLDKISQVLKTDSSNIVNKINQILAVKYNNKILNNNLNQNEINIENLNQNIFFISSYFKYIEKSYEIKKLIDDYKKKYENFIIFFMFNDLKNNGKIIISTNNNFKITAIDISSYIFKYDPYLKGGGKINIAECGKKEKFLFKEFQYLQLEVKNFILKNINI